MPQSNYVQIAAIYIYFVIQPAAAAVRLVCDCLFIILDAFHGCNSNAYSEFNMMVFSLRKVYEMKIS